MPGKAIVEPVIALVVIFLLAALITTLFLQIIAAMLRLRAWHLRWRLVELFRDQGLCDSVLGHPAISMDGSLPSSVSPQAFSLALVQTLSQRAQAPEASAKLRFAVLALPESPLKSALLTMFRDYESGVAEIESRIETWFARASAIISQQYARYAQVASFALTTMLAAACGADAIAVFRSLWLDPSGAMLMQIPFGSSPSFATNLPGVFPTNPWQLRLLGYLLTGLACAFATPAWFDLLRKMIGDKSSEKSLSPTTLGSIRSTIEKLSDSTNLSSPLLAALATGGIIVSGTLALSPGGKVELAQPAIVKLNADDLTALSDSLRIKVDPIRVNLDPQDLSNGIQLKADNIQFPKLNASLSLPQEPAIAIKVDGIDIKTIEGHLAQIERGISTTNNKIEAVSDSTKKIDADLATLNPQMIGRGGIEGAR